MRLFTSVECSFWLIVKNKFNYEMLKNRVLWGLKINKLHLEVLILGNR